MKGEYFMMKKHGLRRFFSLLLAVFMVCTLLPTAALAEDTTGADEAQPEAVVVDEDEKTQKKEDTPPQNPGQGTPPQNPEQGTPPADDDDSDEGSDSPLLTGSRPVTITVRVFSPSTGVDAVVGSDVAGAGKPGQIQSADYKIPPLTKFVDSSKFGSVTKVAGNWYFPSGDRQPGAIVQWSTNSGTGTMTYWVDWYNPDGGGSTTYLWNFTLKYDANGGSGAPADQTWGTNEKYTKSHTFNIPSTVPTRAGYEFKGWSDTKGGSATRQPGGTCVVAQTASGYNGGSVTKTLYAVWKENAPAQPTPLSKEDVKTLLGNNAVQIICTNTQIGHGRKTFGLIDNTFTVHQNNNRCEVVINSFSPYVDEFNAAVSVPTGTHIADNSMGGQNKTKINLVWSDGKWTAADAPAKYHVLCSLQPAPSSPPTFDELVNILGAEAVKVHCSTPNSGHADVTYPLMAGSFTVGDVQGSSGNYTCVVTVHADKYVTAYGNGHTLTSANESPKIVTLKYNETAKKWERPSSLPITFNVACDNAVPPVAPSEAEVAAMDIWVTVTCTKDPANHPDRMSRPTVESIVRIGNVQTNPVSGEYTCTVEVNSSDYVTQFDKTHGYAVHRPTGKSGYINLTYSKKANKWVAPASPYNVITFQVKCVTSPTFNDLKTIFNQNIHVDCTTESKHTEALYDLIENSYYVYDYTTATDNPRCTVIIRPWLYIDEYNTSFGAHATDSEGKSVALYYADNGWTAAEGAVPVVFKVKCNTEIVPPHKPTDEELAKLETAVEVACTTKPETHAAKRFPLIDRTYNIGDVSGNETDGYFCNITVTADEYVTKYITEFGKHTLTGDNTKPLKLKYVEGQWAVDDPVVFRVSCVPDAPTEGYLKDLLNREVTVTCTTNAAHAPAEYGLLDDSYQGSGVQPDGNGGYTYTVTIAAAEYVKKYNTERPKNHSLVKDEPTEKPVTLVWNANDHKWGFADANAVPVNFNVKCLYTVTYKDGADGSVFKTVSFPDLKKGEATPTIDDPIRVGYKFAGWEPTVAATVTNDVTYTAQWKKVDTTFTVKYNDNVKGKAFKEQVYEDLEYNEDTPGFNGKPTRSGYTFTGWKPVVTDRVTEDVVYYAQWKSNSGKDKVPKTGDGQIVMILGSVLLFSFCGATAVYLNDRKRKQG